MTLGTLFNFSISYFVNSENAGLALSEMQDRRVPALRSG